MLIAAISNSRVRALIIYTDALMDSLLRSNAINDVELSDETQQHVATRTAWEHSPSYGSSRVNAVTARINELVDQSFEEYCRGVPTSSPCSSVTPRRDRAEILSEITAGDIDSPVAPSRNDFDILHAVNPFSSSAFLDNLSEHVGRRSWKSEIDAFR